MTFKRVLLVIAVLGVLFGTGSVVLGFITQNQVAQAQKESQKLALAAKKTGSVLAAEDSVPSAGNDVHFEVNIPAVFNDTVTVNGELIASIFTVDQLTAKALIVSEVEADDLTVTGKLTAPNVLYSLVGTEGLTITGDQELIITNTDKGSSQNIFKTFIVGGDEAEAGSNSDEFTFIAGDNISLALNTTDNKLTIANTYSAPAAPWSTSGTNVYLTTTTNSVGIGTNTPAYKLHVVGDGYVSNAFGVGGDLTVTGAAYLNGATFDGDTTLGNATTDNITFTGRLASGTAILPIVDLGADLGSASLRFNNIYVATINTNSTLSTAGQAIFTYEPTSTAYTQASVLINPTAPPTNSFLLALGQGGLQRAGIDAEGDLTLGYSSGVSAPNSAYPLSIYGHNSTQVASVDTSGNAVFNGSVTASSFIGSTTGSLNPGFTLGSVAFQGASGLTQDNANFFWDDTNNRLGIGTTTPSSSLQIASGQLILPLGSATSPSLSFTTLNRGFYVTSSNRLTAVAESGKPVWQIVDSTLHGLNIMSSYPLTWGSLDGTPDVLVGRDGADILAMRRTTNAQELRIYNSDSTADEFVSLGFKNNSNVFTIETEESGGGTVRDIALMGGEVGIGTATPGQKLDVKNGNIRIDMDTGQGGGFFLYKNGANIARFGVDASNSIAQINTYNTADLHISPASSRDVIFNSGGGATEFMRFDSSANRLGIGASDPLATLDVRGFSGTVPVASISGQTSFAAMVVDNKGLGDIFTASSSGLNRFVITKAGNVGIGTSLPTAPLHITGTGASWVLQVDGTGNTGGFRRIGNNVEVVAGNVVAANIYNIASPLTLGINTGSSGNTSTATVKMQAWNYNASSVVTPVFEISPSIQQTSTAGYQALKINPTESTTGSGAKHLIWAGVGSTGLFGVDNLGNTGIKNVSPQVALHVGSTSVTDGTNLLRLEDANSACNYDANTGSPSCASDFTLKKDIDSLDTVSLLDRISSLRPVSYHWKTEDLNAPLQHGFIAQEVAEQFPELVKDGTWVDGSTRKFLNMGGLMPYVVGAVKEQQLQINQLALSTGTQLSTTHLNDNDFQALVDAQAIQQTELDEQRSLIESLQTQLATIFDRATTFLADVTFKGRLFLNPNQTGIVTIPAGSNSAKITFSHALPQTPVVNATPHQALNGQVVIKDITTDHFVIELSEVQDHELKISWLATLVDEAAIEQPTIEISAPTAAAEPTLTPTPAPPVASPQISPSPDATESATVGN